ncbi:PD-(D/E)XK nuclease family protein [Thalassoglobus sp. JC818]|uniref:PD-(D/E)XK nuclease family protein n=1 Tax=Thalassoglobus sp. JC818 TaxID=3232136 RepID=UPI00345A26BA
MDAEKRVRRAVLDWSRPALHSAAREVIDRFAAGPDRDLSGVMCVFPGKQAGRRFLEILTDLTDGRFIPPEILTVGQLPERLYTPKKPFATLLTQQAAWAQALKKLDPSDLREVVPSPPEEEDVDGWLRLGDVLRRQHRELTADRLDFDDVAKRGESLEGFDETRRWEVLSQVQKLYLEILDGLNLWDQQTARISAIEFKEFATDDEIVLVGMVDLNQTQRGMLAAVADRLTVMVHASPEWVNERFDTFGCVKPGAWKSVSIPIDDSQVQIVDGMKEQSDAVAWSLSELSSEFAMNEITLGVPDDRIVAHLRRTLAAVEIPVHWGIERTLPDSAPYQLLEAIADYLQGESVDDFSRLIRHPDIAHWLSQHDLPFDWLTRWDIYVSQHLQRTTRILPGKKRAVDFASKLVRSISDLIKPLNRAPKPLTDWIEPIGKLFEAVYAEREIHIEDSEDQLLRQAIETIFNAWTEHEKLPESLVPVLSAADAIRLTLTQVQQEFLASSSDEPSIQLYGWLDLALDDAPAVIITSVNEGYIPSSVNHDLFLPNRLRVHLGLEDNDRRYARDAYSLSSILSSRKQVKLISSKHDIRQEPLAPSRLLFATEPHEIARRVVRYFDEQDQTLNRAPIGLTTDRNESDFHIPRPVAGAAEKTSFSVTEFRHYLASPYRYYLNQILRLEEVTDDPVELDPAGFGSLIHAVLEDFGRSDAALQTDPARISEFLNECLNEKVKAEYGSDPLFPIAVQVEQIRHRLDGFARWQAEWIRMGWKIRHTEYGNQKHVSFPLDDGRKIKLRGRIDRIDFNEKTGEWAILDYKTGDSGMAPEKTHRWKEEWVDLQLPLYRHLAKPLGVTGTVKLGYVTLPKTESLIGAQLAEWTEEELKDADRVTRETASKILDGEFWVELEKTPDWYEQFSAICQDYIFEREAIV